MEWWRNFGPANWEQILAAEDADQEKELRRCTFAGRPFGSETFVQQMSERLGRYWVRGRPRKKRGNGTEGASDQLGLFA